jgi:hypothetical protein
MSHRRRHKIEEILNYLEKQELQNSAVRNAVIENISFFRNSYSMLSFYKWLYKKAPEIKPENLLELMDIDSASPYDTELIASLAATERKLFPGLINPLVKRIFHLITCENTGLILSVGSGAMEVERQVISKLVRSGNDKPVVFIGLDISSSSHNFAKQNLAAIKSKLTIIEKKELDDASLQDIMNERKSLYTGILCNNDIFSLDKYFSESRFDLAYNCFFKHHVTAVDSEKIDDILKKHSKKVIEYDGVKNNFNSFVQSLFVWGNPVLLSGTVFSNLRYKKKSELKSTNTNFGIKTYWMKGTHMKEFSAPLIAETK